MEEILLIFLQGLLELLLQLVGSGALDLFAWWGDRDDRPVSRGVTIGVLLFAAGCGLGWLSLWILPHNLLPWAWLRVANLVIGPLLSGWVSWRIARWRERHDAEMVPWHHALGAGLACLGMILVRFVWGVR